MITIDITVVIRLPKPHMEVMKINVDETNLNLVREVLSEQGLERAVTLGALCHVQKQNILGLERRVRSLEHTLGKVTSAKHELEQKIRNIKNKK